MGQFQSKEYDGDPYVDLMRALPERELIWWVQKAIWVSAALLLHAWGSFVLSSCDALRLHSQHR
jgi:hypothetical protein